MCSYRSFWQHDPEAAIQSIADQVRYLEELHVKGPAETLFVKYEEMVLKPSDTMRTIAAFLDIDGAGFREPGDGNGIFARHATSTSPEASVGRWRNDLDKAYIGACETKFGLFLKTFEYEA